MIAFPSMNCGRTGKHGAKPRIAERVRSRLSPETSSAAFPEISDTRPSINGKRVRVYQGIGLRTEPDEEPEEEPELEPEPLATVEDVVKTFGGWVDDCTEESCQ